MQLLEIKRSTASILYAPAEDEMVAGVTLSLLEPPGYTEGLIVQVLESETAAYAGAGEQAIQYALEAHLGAEVLVDGERGDKGLEMLLNLRVAQCRIRARVRGGNWEAWDGCIVGRAVSIQVVEPEELLGRTLPAPFFPLRSFCRSTCAPIRWDGPRWDGLSLVVGDKGRGKSHWCKHLIVSLSEHGVPVFAVDVNREYRGLPGVQILRWGRDWRLHLHEVGHKTLSQVMRAVYPLAPDSPSESAFEAVLPGVFAERKSVARERGRPFRIDIPYLRDVVNWSGSQFISDAITQRLHAIHTMGLFYEADEVGPSVADLYDGACNCDPVVCDIASLSDKLASALVKTLIMLLEQQTDREQKADTGRYPYLILDEAHQYCTEQAITSICTRSRHSGISTIFSTNSPSKLPEAAFRQADNLVMLGINHDSDIRAVSHNALIDKDSVEALATRLPDRHALVVGRVTSGYPLVVEVGPLPEGVLPSGVTRSTWDRFR